MSFALVQVTASFLKKDEILNEDDFNFEITYPHWEDIVEDVKEQDKELSFKDYRLDIDVNESKIKVKLLKDCIGFNFKIIGDGSGIYDTGIAWEYEQVGCDIFEDDIEEFIKKANEIKKPDYGLDNPDYKEPDIVRFLALYSYETYLSNWEYNEYDSETSLEGFVSINDIYSKMIKDK